MIVFNNEIDIASIPEDEGYVAVVPNSNFSISDSIDMNVMQNVMVILTDVKKGKYYEAGTSILYPFQTNRPVIVHSQLLRQSQPKNLEELCNIISSNRITTNYIPEPIFIVK